MLKIRMQRVGRKHEPSFRIVLTESKNSSKSGRLKEILGSYDPRKTVDLIKVDRVKYWLKRGVKPTGTVHNLFVNHKLIDGPKVNVLPRKSPSVKEEVSQEEVNTAAATPVDAPVEAPATAEAPAETPAE